MTWEVVGVVGKEMGGLVILCEALANGRNILLVRSVRWYILRGYLKVFATNWRPSVKLQSRLGSFM